MSFRMPAEWQPHERTPMAWPVHPAWGDMAVIGDAFPHHEIVGVEARVISPGGGPHCATIQIPTGATQ